MVIFFLLALSFYLNNSQSVTVRYYMDVEYEMSLSFLLWITLCLGIIVGWVAGMAHHLKRRRQLTRTWRHQQQIRNSPHGVVIDSIQKAS